MTVLLWVFNNWVAITALISAVGNVVLFFAHLTNKANLAQVVEDVEKILGRVDIKPDPDSAQVQSELKNPKV